MVPEPEKQELDAVWAEVGKPFTTSKAEPVDVRYAVPNCALRYELRSVVLGDVTEGRGPAGIEIVAELVANPDTDHLTWQLVDLAATLLHDGERNARPKSKTRWASVRVRTDGEQWFEERGPTTLWSSYSAVPPLAGQFPPIPETPEIGKTSMWKIETHDERTTTKVQKRRETNPDAAVPNFTPDVAEVSLSVAGFQRLTRDERSIDVLVLEGTWTTQKTLLDPSESQRAERWRGRWVITEKGRLLHGISMAGRYQWWATTDEERNSKLGSHEIEMRLVEDCDGPALARFARD